MSDRCHDRERDSSDDGSTPATDGGVQADPEAPGVPSIASETVGSADFGRLQGHEHLDDLGLDTDHCIRCGFCTNACPVFEETGWESVSPRGHANVINSYLDGDLHDDEEPDHFKENLDLCIKCKQCIAPCPAGVEIPKLVIRANEQYNEEHGTSLGDRVFANPRRANRLGSLVAPLSNRLNRIGPVRRLMETILGIDARRELPEFHRETFEDWFADHTPDPSIGDADLDRDVAVFVDCYVNYNFPDIGAAAVRVLERMGARVELAENGCCGRAALSKGMITEAEAYADADVHHLAELVAAGYDIVCVEPSCAAMLKDEYTDMYDSPRVDAIADNSYELMEYVARHLTENDGLLAFDPVDRHLAYHSHCHTKHLGIDTAAADVLRRVPGTSVDEPHVSCCGMAGSFGYQAKYYDLSMDIGEGLFAQIRESDGDPVATGFSCRSQIKDGMDVSAEHPVEVIEESTRP